MIMMLLAQTKTTTIYYATTMLLIKTEHINFYVSWKYLRVDEYKLVMNLFTEQKNCDRFFKTLHFFLLALSCKRTRPCLHGPLQRIPYPNSIIITPLAVSISEEHR